MTEKVLGLAAEPSAIKSVSIISNKTGEAVDISPGISMLMYFESILQDTLRVTIRFVDSGDSTKEGKTVREGLPLVGQERVEIEFEDNNEIAIGADPKLVLYVNKITPVENDTNIELIQLELVSKEFILNEKIRVNTRYDGKISEHITDILKDNENYLATEKELDIEEVENNFNFIGNNKKPFFMVNALSKKSVPVGKKGKAAGFFFYETSDGFHFKSLDTLLDPSKNEKVKSVIYNETPESKGVNIPEGYDMKALEYKLDNRVNVQEKLKLGAYDSKIILFDPFDCYYQVVTDKAEDKDTEQSAGKELPVLNNEFERVNQPQKNSTRTTYCLVDRGSLPTGDTSEQIDGAEAQNFEYLNITNQAIRRYNQFYSSKVTITLPGDFSLHVGNAIFVDAPGLSAEKDGGTDQEAGGIYIIADLCHYLTTEVTYTKLNLVRDTVGRKGTAS
tara:strand:+ start:166 stop:1509 length:1344 start_codon:yes stop_codon:yes gene_type:complete